MVKLKESFSLDIEKKSTMTNISTLVPFIMVFSGCISTMIFFEYLIQFSADAGSMVTFTEVAFVLLQTIPGLFENGKLRKLRISKTNHVIHAFLWVSMLWLGNFAYTFNIKVPIHTIFRACNIVSSVVIGYLIFGSRYTTRQILSVLSVTFGVICATIGDAKIICQGIDPSRCSVASMIARFIYGNPEEDIKNVAAEAETNNLWIIGVTILIFVLFLQAMLGHMQRKWYLDAGPENKKQVSDEFLIISHIFGLVPSLMAGPSIIKHWNMILETPVLHPSIPIPIMLACLILNNITQAICIKGVFKLAAAHPPLTVNITLSVRKFLTVCMSIFWFNNPWTILHVVAMVLVFGGALAYSTGNTTELKKDEDQKKKK